ncbi:MAG: lytic murein transglycosylase B [Sulfurovum sp.]|nr:MAG: lytic murein transglycosylase B [Sulfurovum sp.]RUM70492.1 MAG: lytic murein transglycosylase B [Sulfurovum sp.]RUM75312.1 MAG: lytic murein transglycosylase B [Sulfurovum sp.]
MKIVYISIVMLFFSQAKAKDYTKNLQAIQCMDTLLKKYGFTQNELIALFSNVTVQQEALNAFVPREKQKRIKDTRTPAQVQKAKQINLQYGAWERYVRLKVTEKRIRQGVDFIQKHKKTFEEVEKKYGVPKEYIAAILGVETVYGKNVGKYPIFDTLVTLAFEENRRNDFFRKELIHFLRLSKSQHFNPKDVKGSHAGAIGLGQFLPSNYDAYGVDFDKDGKITLQKADDAIASIGNYLKKNGWRKDEPVAVHVFCNEKRFSRYETGHTHFYNPDNLVGLLPLLPWNYKGKVCLIKLEKKEYDEIWYGAKNFFVITRYNHSDYYAMSIHQLAQKIKKRFYEN